MSNWNFFSSKAEDPSVPTETNLWSGTNRVSCSTMLGYCHCREIFGIKINLLLVNSKE